MNELEQGTPDGEEDWPPLEKPTSSFGTDPLTMERTYKSFPLIGFKTSDRIRMLQASRGLAYAMQSGEYQKEVERFWESQFMERKAEPGEVEPMVITARHREDHVLPYDPKAGPKCLGCDLEYKASTGRPVLKYMVHVMREVHPIELVEQPMRPQQHKKRRNQTEAYHKRIQKKWNKLVKGLTEKVPRREAVVLALSGVAMRVVRDMHRRATI